VVGWEEANGRRWRNRGSGGGDPAFPSPLSQIRWQDGRRPAAAVASIQGATAAALQSPLVLDPASRCMLLATVAPSSLEVLSMTAMGGGSDGGMGGDW
jgi:hypothetical protein